MKLKYSIIIITLLIAVILIELFKPSFNRIENGEIKIAKIENEELVNINDYKTITIGDQTWMAENLWVKVKNSFSVNNNPDNDRQLGRLYTWETAIKICPNGWKLPTKNDYEKLLKNFKWKNAGNEIKIGGSSGFNACLPGYFDHNDSSYYGYGIYGQYWTSDQYHFTDCAWMLYVDSSMTHATFNWYLSNKDGFSVRYIKE